MLLCVGLCVVVCFKFTFDCELIDIVLLVRRCYGLGCLTGVLLFVIVLLKLRYVYRCCLFILRI